MLTKRQNDILRLIIQHYTSSGVPVGSKTYLWEVNMEYISPENALDSRNRQWKIYSRNMIAPPNIGISSNYSSIFYPWVWNDFEELENSKAIVVFVHAWRQKKFVHITFYSTFICWSMLLNSCQLV